MNYVLKRYINKISLVYLDDIIIQEHYENIRKILARLKQYNLKIQLDKSEFIRNEVAYLGLTNNGIK